MATKVETETTTRAQTAAVSANTNTDERSMIAPDVTRPYKLKEELLNKNILEI